MHIHYNQNFLKVVFSRSELFKCHTLCLLIICWHLLEQGTSTSGHEVFWWAWHSLEARLETNTRWLYALLRLGNILTSSWDTGKDCLQCWQDSRRKEQTFLWWSIRFLRKTVSLHPELEHLIRSYWQTFRWSWEREWYYLALNDGHRLLGSFFVINLQHDLLFTWRLHKVAFCLQSGALVQ